MSDSKGRPTRADISDHDALRAIDAYTRENRVNCDATFPFPPKVHAPFPTERLPFPEKVIEAKLYHLDDRGLIEYGVSLRTAWLTPEGVALLEALNRGGGPCAFCRKAIQGDPVVCPDCGEKACAACNFTRCGR